MSGGRRVGYGYNLVPGKEAESPNSTKSFNLVLRDISEDTTDMAVAMKPPQMATDPNFKSMDTSIFNVSVDTVLQEMETESGGYHASKGKDPDPVADSEEKHANAADGDQHNEDDVSGLNPEV